MKLPSFRRLAAMGALALAAGLPALGQQRAIAPRLTARGELLKPPPPPPTRAQEAAAAREGLRRMAAAHKKRLRRQLKRQLIGHL